MTPTNWEPDWRGELELTIDNLDLFIDGVGRKIIKETISRLITQAREEERGDIISSVVETVSCADAPYTTECCRKTANYYKEQIIDQIHKDFLLPTSQDKV